jgi:hypothetical protein
MDGMLPADMHAVGTDDQPNQYARRISLHYATHLYLGITIVLAHPALISLSPLHQVIQQWLTIRCVTPLRIVLRGPPMSGKSVLASRLASTYRLPLISAKDLLAAAGALSPEDAKVCVCGGRGWGGGRPADSGPWAAMKV